MEKQELAKNNQDKSSAETVGSAEEGQTATLAPPPFKVNSGPPAEMGSGSEMESPISEYQIANGSADDDLPSYSQNKNIPQIEVPYQLKNAIKRENNIEGEISESEENTNHSINMILTQGDNNDSFDLQSSQEDEANLDFLYSCDENDPFTEMHDKEEKAPQSDEANQKDLSNPNSNKPQNHGIVRNGFNMFDSQASDSQPQISPSPLLDPPVSWEQKIKEKRARDIQRRHEEWKKEQAELKQKKAQNISASRARIKAQQDAWIKKHPDIPTINGVIPQSEEHAGTLRKEEQKNKFHNAWLAERQRIKPADEKDRKNRIWREDMIKRGKGPDLAKWDFNERQRNFKGYDQPTDDQTEVMLWMLSGVLIITPAGPLITGISATFFIAQGIDMTILGDDDLEINGWKISKKWRGNVYTLANLATLPFSAKGIYDLANAENWSTATKGAAHTVNFLINGDLILDGIEQNF